MREFERPPARLGISDVRRLAALRQEPAYLFLDDQDPFSSIHSHRVYVVSWRYEGALFPQLKLSTLRGEVKG